MTKKEQRKILRDLTRSILRKLLEHSYQWPKEWDGHEIRELLFNAAAWERSHLMTSLSNSRTKRKREFDNEWAVRNLY